MIRMETPRLLVREIETEDILSLVTIYRNPINMQYIPNAQRDWTLASLTAKYEQENKNIADGYGIWAVQLKQSMGVIGEAGLFNSFNDPQHLELGYIIDQKFVRQGFGTEICQALIRYGFQTLNLQRITARMFDQNVASIRLSEKCGMVLVNQGMTDKNEYFSEYEIRNSNENK